MLLGFMRLVLCIHYTLDSAIVVIINVLITKYRILFKLLNTELFFNYFFSFT